MQGARHVGLFFFVLFFWVTLGTILCWLWTCAGEEEEEECGEWEDEEEEEVIGGDALMEAESSAQQVSLYLHAHSNALSACGEAV